LGDQVFSLPDNLHLRFRFFADLADYLSVLWGLSNWKLSGRLKDNNAQKPTTLLASQN